MSNTPRTPRPAATTRPIPALEHAARALLVGSAVLAPLVARWLPDADCYAPEFPRAGLFTRTERAGAFHALTDPADTRADECPALPAAWLPAPAPLRPPPNESPIAAPPPEATPPSPAPPQRPTPPPSSRPPAPPTPQRHRPQFVGEMGLVSLTPLTRRRRGAPETTAGACAAEHDDQRG